MRNNHGMTAHLLANDPGGRVVEYDDGTLAITFPSQEGGYGYAVVTRGGLGRGERRTLAKEAKAAVAERLGLDSKYMLATPSNCWTRRSSVAAHRGPTALRLRVPAAGGAVARRWRTP
jgi:hypothetical protein